MKSRFCVICLYVITVDLGKLGGFRVCCNQPLCCVMRISHSFSFSSIIFSLLFALYVSKFNFCLLVLSLTHLCSCVCDAVCVNVCLSCSCIRVTGLRWSVRASVTSLHVCSQRLKWSRYFPFTADQCGVRQQETHPSLDLHKHRHTDKCADTQPLTEQH